MDRRGFLAWSAGVSAMLMCPGSSGAGQRSDGLRRDVSWLVDVQRPPQAVPVPERPLAPLLIDDQSRPITTVPQWEVALRKIREAWLKFLGPMPAERPALKLEVLQEDRPAGCVRQLVRYQAEADEFVEGYLLLPDPLGTARRSAIVALHQTANSSIDEIAGVTGPEAQHLGLQLCRAGHVVFCPRCYLWQTPPKYQIDVKGTVAAFHKRHPETLGMHKMLFDAQRGVDVLASLPNVDAQRIGAAGHSLGAKEALYLAAFDERIKAAVASEGGIGFSSTNWHDPWYLGAGIKAAEFGLNHHQLLALIAPRPFLVLGGEMGAGAADGDRSWPYLAAALSVYRLYGEPARLGLLNHRQGHSIPDEVRHKMLEWLQTYTA